MSETCRKCGISPTTSDNWRKMAMDAGRRELAGIGGSCRSDPAKATSKEIESLKIVVGEQALVNAELKKKARSRGEGERGQGGGGGGDEPEQGAQVLRRLAPGILL